MGNCAGSAEQRRSRRIDEELAREKIENERVLQFHLCDRDEDHRLMKQLRRQYSDNWPLLTEVEREHRRQQVFRVVVTQLADLLAMVESVEVGEAEWTQRVHHERDSGSAIMMNPKLVECLVGVWENESVQAALEESREEDTFGDLEYFMNNADRVLRRDAVVSFEDWNHVNLQSTDVDSHKFELVGYTLSIVEIHDVTRVGGNRRKWEHMFEFADKLIYVVPINEFDQASLRDPRVNAIMDDMDAFARTVNNEFNWHKRVFLVFTNYALFCDKLQIMPIKIVDPAHPERNRWTDYTGVEGMSETFWDSQEEADQGIEYFKGKFLDLVERRSYREVVSHVVDVSDGVMVHNWMQSVTQSVLAVNLVDPNPFPF